MQFLNSKVMQESNCFPQAKKFFDLLHENRMLCLQASIVAIAG